MSGFTSKAEIGGADKQGVGEGRKVFNPSDLKIAERRDFRKGSKIRIEPLSTKQTVNLRGVYR
jgi:hypothetical protein